VTDEFSEAYKEIAEKAVTALGAKISGIDLIIPDKEADPETTPEAYGIIEANFNPAMHMHVYPYAGKSRRLTQDVLRLLISRSNVKNTVKTNCFHGVFLVSIFFQHIQLDSRDQQIIKDAADQKNQKTE
jgi:hypothetical protein